MMSFKAIEKRHLDHQRAGMAARCPLCLSEEVEGRAIDVTGSRMEQPMSCNACGASWQECYTIDQIIFCNLGSLKSYGGPND